MPEVKMPQLGETVAEGTITKWFKQVGDRVEADEILFEVSTDKVDSEVPSPAAGYLSEILVAEGETAEVGAVLAILADEQVGAQAAPGEGAAAPDAPPGEGEPALAPAPEPEIVGAAQPDAERPGPEPEPARAPDAVIEPGLLVSPMVRRLIGEAGLDPGAIEGTGPGGRITRSDVQRAIEASGGLRAAPARDELAERPRPNAAPAPLARSGERDIVVPFNNIRRLTGEYTLRSKQVSPHVLTAVEVDFEGVDRVRRAVRETWREEEGFSLTYLPFIARALVDAIRDFPYVNASVGDGELIVHDHVNLAIAVDLGFEGLLAPVVRDADTKRLRAVAREIVDMAGRARSKQLSPDEVADGTFTVTNPGQYGTFMQFPIINQPQVAILSTDGVRRKPVVVTDEQGAEAIAIHSVGILALAWDHRAFDGAYVAAFLDRLRELIETRDWEAEL